MGDNLMLMDWGEIIWKREARQSLSAKDEGWGGCGILWYERRGQDREGEEERDSGRESNKVSTRVSELEKANRIPGGRRLGWMLAWRWTWADRSCFGWKGQLFHSNPPTMVDEKRWGKLTKVRMDRVLLNTYFREKKMSPGEKRGGWHRV